MFESQKRLYFVFSDNNDTYCLKSMLRVKLREYLYLSAKKSGYDTVLFLNGKPDNTIEVTVFDFESFSKNKTDDGFLKHTLWNASAKPAAFPQTVNIGAVSKNTKKWLIGRLREESTAIIADLPALGTIWREYSRDDKYHLINTVHHEKAGSLIINAPVELNRDALALLTGKDGIIEYKTQSGGKHLIPDAGTVDSDATPYVLEEIRKRMPTQWLELGYIGFDELGVIIDSAYFKKGEILDEARRLDLVNFFYYWLYSPKFRMDSFGPSGFFSKVTGRVTRSELYNFISGDCETAINERIAAQRRMYEKTTGASPGNRLCDILIKNYGQRDRLPGTLSASVRLDCPALSRLGSLKMPDIAEKSGAPGFNIVRTTKADWDAMRQSVLRPMSTYPSEVHLGWVSRFSSVLEQAETRGDPDTVNRALNVLMYCGTNLAKDAAAFDEHCKLSDVYLKTSSDFFSLMKELKKAESAPETWLSGSQMKVTLDRCAVLHEALNRSDKLLVSAVPDLSVDIKEITDTLNKLSDDLSQKTAKTTVPDSFLESAKQEQKTVSQTEEKKFAPSPIVSGVMDSGISELAQDMSEDEAMAILSQEP